MSLRTQAKVLRVLQEGEVERIGSQKTLEVDVRVIAATNKELEKEIERERFREDLFFRLSVIPIRVPPLRERVDDIEPLVEHFIDQFLRGEQLQAQDVGGRGDAVAAAPTPGAATCGSCATRSSALVIMIPDAVILEAHVSEVVRPTRGDSPNLVTAAQTLKEFKEASERAFLVHRLREGQWNISATAQAIGTPRSNLYKKLEQYAISQEKDA